LTEALRRVKMGVWMILYDGTSVVPRMPKRIVSHSVKLMRDIIGTTYTGVKSGNANIGLLTINAIKGDIANTT